MRLGRIFPGDLCFRTSRGRGSDFHPKEKQNIVVYTEPSIAKEQMNRFIAEFVSHLQRLFGGWGEPDITLQYLPKS